MGANNQMVYPKWKQCPCRTSEHKCHAASNWSKTKSGWYPQVEASFGCYIRSISDSSVHSSWWQTLAAPWSIFFSQICPWAREAFQSKPTFLAPCSYAGPSEYASPWDGATVMEWFPGPADLVVGAWTPHCGGASAMDPNEHFYSRSQGIYTLHLTPNTLKSKEIVTGKRDQKTEKTKPKTNLQQPQNIKMYNKLNWKWRKQSNLWLKCKAGLQKLQATVNHPDTLKSVDYQLLTNSAHQWFYGNQLELYFNPSCKQSTIGLELLSKSLRPIFWPWLPVPSPYWFSMPCPLSLSLNLWSQVQMPPSTGKSPFLFVVLSIPSTHCGANSTLM